MEKIIENALEFAKEYFQNFCCGHDFEHVKRVLNNAQLILREEQFDVEIDAVVVMLAAILHDVDDTKLVKSKDNKAMTNTLAFLKKQNLSAERIKKITEIISTVGMSEYLNNNRPVSVEAKIVFDADKLEQTGAIAIARSFAYGSVHGRKIFESEHFPDDYFDGKYPDGYASSVNYIIEVLLKVKSILHTNTAIKIAEKRHKFMVDFLNEFFEEEGNKEWKDYFFSKTRY